MEFGVSFFCEILDGGPYYHVVGPRVLKTQVGSAKLIDNPLAKMEKDGRGYGLPLESCGDYSAVVCLHNMLVDFTKKDERLRWGAMSFACDRVEGIKILEGAKLVAYLDC